MTKPLLVKRGFIVGVARFELTISWSQTKRDTGLRYTPKISSRKTIGNAFSNTMFLRFSFEPNFFSCQASLALVIPAGFEPATYCLEGSCSIQLSYETLSANSGTF